MGVKIKEHLVHDAGLSVTIGVRLRVQLVQQTRLLSRSVGGVGGVGSSMMSTSAGGG